MADNAVVNVIPADEVKWPNEIEKAKNDVHFTKTVKMCKICGETKPLTSVNFQPHSNSPDGFTNTCNDCRKKRNPLGRPKKSKTLMEVFKNEKPEPPLEMRTLMPLSKDEKIKIAHEMTSPDQQALELIESLFPDGIQPRQYKGLLKTIKLMLKMEE